MQIVIDIDDEYVLSDIKNRSLETESETDKVIINALYNGTPLPKGHGDLIDKKVAYKKFYVRCLAGVATEVFAETPTIIEADKEGKNE